MTASDFYLQNTSKKSEDDIQGNLIYYSDITWMFVLKPGNKLYANKYKYF